MSTPAGNFEVVKLSIDPLFQSTQNNDFAMYTDNSNQSIHIGCGSNPALPATIKVTSSNVSVVGDITTTGNVVVGGNLTVNGTSTTVDTQQLLIEDNVITLNKNQTGTPASFLQSGIEVERGDQPNYMFVFDEATDLFKVGMSNQLQAVSTRADAMTAGYPYYNATTSRLENKTFATSDFPDGVISSAKLSSTTGTPSSAIVLSDTPTVSNATLGGTTSISGHVIPTSNLAYDLGSSNARFRDLFLSGNTIDMAGTRITADSSNNIKITDSTNTLKRIIVDEIQIGETAGGALRLKKDTVGGGFKFFDVASSGIEASSSNINSGGSSGGVSLSNILQSITSSFPANGYSAGTVSVPIVNMKTVPANANISYGQVEFTSHSGVSLVNNASMSVDVTHNLGSTSYIVYATPELGSSVQVNITNKTANTFTMTIKNVSGASIADPVVNYQLIQAALSSQAKVIASPVTVTTSTSNIQAYSGATSTSKIVAIPAGFVTDPHGYPITYTLSNDTTGRATLTGSNLTYTHLKSNATGTVVVRAQNPYNNDATKIVTFNLTETLLNQPLSATSTTQSTTQSSTGSGQAASSNLPTTDQGLTLSYTLGTNNIGASISGNIVNWTSAGATGTRSAVINASFAAPIMAEAALAAKVMTLIVAETLALANMTIPNTYTKYISSTSANQAYQFTYLSPTNSGQTITYAITNAGGLTTSMPAATTVQMNSKFVLGTYQIALSASGSGLQTKNLTLNVSEFPGTSGWSSITTTCATLNTSAEGHTFVCAGQTIKGVRFKNFPTTSAYGTQVTVYLMKVGGGPIQSPIALGVDHTGYHYMYNIFPTTESRYGLQDLNGIEVSFSAQAIDNIYISYYSSETGTWLPWTATTTNIVDVKY